MKKFLIFCAFLLVLQHSIAMNIRNLPLNTLFNYNELLGFQMISLQPNRQYIGHTLNSKRHGNGLTFLQEGGFERGNWKNDRLSGYGMITTSSISGERKIPTSKQDLTYGDGINSYYKGEFVDGIPKSNSEMVCFSPDGSVIIGEIAANFELIKGIMWFSSINEIFIGTCETLAQNGEQKIKKKIISKGVYLIQNGDIYIGATIDSLKHGKGIEIIDDEYYEVEYDQNELIKRELPKNKSPEEIIREIEKQKHEISLILKHAEEQRSIIVHEIQQQGDFIVQYLNLETERKLKLIAAMAQKLRQQEQEKQKQEEALKRKKQEEVLKRQEEVLKRQKQAQEKQEREDKKKQKRIADKEAENKLYEKQAEELKRNREENRKQKENKKRRQERIKELQSQLEIKTLKKMQLEENKMQFEEKLQQIRATQDQFQKKALKLREELTENKKRQERIRESQLEIKTLKKTQLEEKKMQLEEKKTQFEEKLQQIRATQDQLQKKVLRLYQQNQEQINDIENTKIYFDKKLPRSSSCAAIPMLITQQNKEIDTDITYKDTYIQSESVSNRPIIESSMKITKKLNIDNDKHMLKQREDERINAILDEIDEKKTIIPRSFSFSSFDSIL